MCKRRRLPANLQVMRLLIAGAILALGLAGCAGGPSPGEASPGEASPGEPGPRTLATARPLPTQGATEYRILPESSELRLRVYRGGPLADLGHNHVIVTSRIEGRLYLQPQLADSGFALRVPVDGFQVDPAQARGQEGKDFAGQLSAEDRQATKDNMLGPEVLDAKAYPSITLRSLGLTGPPWYPRITLRITLHGVSRDYVVPTAIVREPGRLTAIGGLHIRQSDFGITPFTALGGGLRVKDGVDIAFHFVAAPVAD